MTAIDVKTIAAHSGERLLTRKEAAELLGLSPRTLANWTSSGRSYGPPMVRVGIRSARYRLSDVLAFMAELETVAAAR